MDFIETPLPTKKAQKRGGSLTKKATKVRSSVDKAKDDYKLAKAGHKAEIKKLRDQIKTHKLLIKQAKTTYKLVKLANK